MSEPETHSELLSSVSSLLRELFLFVHKTGFRTLIYARRLINALARTYAASATLPTLLKGFCRRQRRAILARFTALQDYFAKEGFRGGLALFFTGVFSQLTTRSKFNHATAISGLLVLFIMIPFWTSRSAAYWDENNANAVMNMTVSSVALQNDGCPESTPALLSVSSAFQPASTAASFAAASSSQQNSAETAQSEKNKTDKKSSDNSQNSSSSKAAKPVKKVSAKARFSGDPFAFPQCVWFAWGRAREVTGISLQFKSDGGRSAKNWLNMVSQRNGVKVVHDPKAVRANALAVFSRGGGGNGHVLFIESVRTNSKGNPVSVTISESNWGSNRLPHEETMSWDEFSSRSKGSLKGYIYLG